MEKELSESEIDKKLAQLEKMKEGNALRINRYLKKKREQGYKNISALIRVESYEIINGERDKALKEGKQLTAAQIIEHALQVAYQNKSSKQATPPKESQPLSPSPVDEVPLTEPVNILSRIAEMKAQKISYDRMADILNEEGLKTQRGKDFTRANIETLHRRGGN